MSTTRTRIRNTHTARFVRTTVIGASPADTPYWLLWSTGIVAFVLSIVAFVLWGINGASTLFDMIVALCT